MCGVFVTCVCEVYVCCGMWALRAERLVICHLSPWKAQLWDRNFVGPCDTCLACSLEGA